MLFSKSKTQIHIFKNPNTNTSFSVWDFLFRLHRSGIYSDQFGAIDEGPHVDDREAGPHLPDGRGPPMSDARGFLDTCGMLWEVSETLKQMWNGCSRHLLEIWVLLGQGMPLGLNRSVNKDNCRGEGYGGSSWSETQGRGFRFVSLKTIQGECGGGGKVDREDLKTS